MGLTRLILVRHAHAGERGGFSGPDIERPLSDRGWLQAEELVPYLAGTPFSELWSSSAVRCVQTLQPLSRMREIPVGIDDRLLEGHDAGDTMRWLTARVSAASLVACTHGDLIPQLLDLAAGAGCPLPPDPRWAKGSVWILDRDGNRWTGASYHRPDA